MDASVKFGIAISGTGVLAPQISLAQPAFILDLTFRPTITAPGGKIQFAPP